MIDPRDRPALVGWSVPAFAMYGIDKRQAQHGGGRGPEAVLHGLALIGRVPGAWALPG